MASSCPRKTGCVTYPGLGGRTGGAQISHIRVNALTLAGSGRFYDDLLAKRLDTPTSASGAVARSLGAQLNLFQSDIHSSSMPSTPLASGKGGDFPLAEPWCSCSTLDNRAYV
jgi:hypothetical protein